MREVAAPEGYLLAEDVRFVISENGVVTSGAQYDEADGRYRVFMDDTPISTNEIKGEKRWIDGGNENNTRPECITLILQRRQADDEWLD